MKLYYKEEFQRMTVCVSTRALRKLNRYEEGKDFVREFISEWKEKYLKRKAIIEELNKVILPKER